MTAVGRAPDTWRGTTRSPWAIPFAALSLGLVVVFAFVRPWLAVSGAVLAVVMSFFVSVRVTVGAHGLRARSGLVPWPSIHLPLDRITAADEIDVRPRSWGGWGYRGSVRVLRRAAWLLRAGPGIKLTLTDGRVFVVTVDKADEGVAVLQRLLRPAPKR